MAKNIDVIHAFIHGGTKTKTKNLRIEDNKLINYGTAIAERYEKMDDELGYVVNTTKYSQSTSTIQNALVRELDDRGIYFTNIRSVKKGAESLIQ